MADQSTTHMDDGEIAVRNYWLGARLWIAALNFFFLAFAFTFLYLRSLNPNHMWHPAAVKAPVAWGTAVIAAVVASAVVYLFARQALNARLLAAWRWGALAALVLGAVAAALQIVEYRNLGFGPGGGGFASTFLAWTGGYLVVVLGMLYWLETLWAQSLRAGDALDDASRAQEYQALAANAEGFGAVWSFLAMVGVAAYLLLYWVG